MVQTPDQSTLFKIVDLDVTEISQFPNGIDDIYTRQINGMIMRNVFSKADLATVVPPLLSDSPPLKGTLLRHAFVFGQALIVSPPDLQDYFQEAESFRQDCRRLFQESQDFETKVVEILGQLSGQRPIEVPPAPHNKTYTPATIRVLRDGQFIAPHCGNQFLHGFPQYWHLSKLVELEDQLSCFVVLNAPDAGGDLVLYDLEWADTKTGRYRGEIPIEEVIGKCRRQVTRLSAGDMILFDGGRIWHEVSPVIGEAARITIGGFAALSQDHQRVYYWS